MINENFPVLGEIPSIKSSHICPLNFIKKSQWYVFSSSGNNTISHVTHVTLIQHILLKDHVPDLI